MCKVITFSTKFPATHPKKGAKTWFVEKVTRARHLLGGRPVDINCDFDEEMYYICEPKYHTIRAGNRWRSGDKFSPRIWGGKPYASKQITFSPDIEIKKVMEIKIAELDDRLVFFIDRKFMGDWHPFNPTLQKLAENDGLTAIEMIQWFAIHPKKQAEGFTGQILCWNEEIEYV